MFSILGVLHIFVPLRFEQKGKMCLLPYYIVILVSSDNASFYDV